MPLLTFITEQVLARVPGGTGRYSREVAAAVGAAAPPDWRVRGVTAWHRDVRAAEIPGVAGPDRLPVDGRVLARLWERGLPPTVRGSVVHALTPLAPARLRRGQSLVVTVHDAVPFTHPETLTPHGAAWHRRMIERAARLASALVVPTRAVADQLAAAGVGGRVEVIGEGVSTSLSGPVDAARADQVRREFGLPARYLLAVGTLEPRKGLTVLLDALAGDPGRADRLVVVGQTGWGGLDLGAEVDRRGLADRVFTLGRVADSALEAVMAGAAALVVPSISEGFGLPLLEAMSRGVPVIHSDAPALVEVAGGGGRSFPVGDVLGLSRGIADVLDHPELAARMSASGRLRAQVFSWESVAEQLWAVYASVPAPGM